MRELKATPGPWEADSGETPLMTVCLVGDVAVGAYEVTAPNIDDARLIAAAPELYSVLETAVMQGERILNGEPPEEGEGFDGWFLAAKAALAKARGEQP